MIVRLVRLHIKKPVIHCALLVCPLIGWFLVARTQKSQLAWLLVPALMALVSCLLSAGADIGTRYAFPIVFAAPYLLCVFMRAVLKDAAGSADKGWDLQPLMKQASETP